MRSVVVVLPASMCAMIPMLRIDVSGGESLGSIWPSAAVEAKIEPLRSPGEVRERLVGVGHAVDVLAAGDGGAFSIVGGHQLVGELDSHRPPLFLTCRHQNPADRERLLADLVDLHRNLIRR